MRAIVVTEHGGPEVLRVRDVDAPTPGVGQVRVRHTWVGVNYVDLLHRAGGHYPLALPFTPGVEGVGVVEALGDGVADVRVGDRVSYTGFHDASYADAGVVPADRLVPTPADLDDRLVAAVAMQGNTAAVLLTMAQPVAQGEVVVVTGAGGGVGAMVTQAASAAGARVVALASSAAKQEYARASGAERVVATPNELPAVVAELTGGVGAVAAYDAVGAATSEAILASLAVRGHYVLYGKSSGAVTGFNLDRLSGFHDDSIRGAVRLSWVSGYHYLLDRSDLVAVGDTVARWLRDGTLRPRIGGEFALEEAADAHRAIEGREIAGKVLLRVGA